MDGAAADLRLELLPAPEADEVVAVIGQPAQVGIEVEPIRLVRALRAGTHAIVEVVVDVRARQVHGAPLTIASADLEVAGIGFRNDQRAEGGPDVVVDVIVLDLLRDTAQHPQVGGHSTGW